MSSSSEWSTSDYSSSSSSYSSSDPGSGSGSEYSSDRSVGSASPNIVATAQPVRHGGASDSEETAVSSPGPDTSTSTSGVSDIAHESASVISSDGDGSEADAHAEEMWFEEAAWGDEASDQDDGGDAHDSSAWAAGAWNSIGSDGGEGVSENEDRSDGDAAHDLPNGTTNGVPNGVPNSGLSGHDGNGVADSDDEAAPAVMIIDFPALPDPLALIEENVMAAVTSLAMVVVQHGDAQEAAAPPPTYRNAMSEPPAYAHDPPAESVEDVEPLPLYEHLEGVRQAQWPIEDASQPSTSAPHNAPELSSGPEPESTTTPRTNSTHGPECACNLCNILYPTPQVATTPPLPPPNVVRERERRQRETTPLADMPQQHWGYAAVAATPHTENEERRRRRRRRRRQQQQEHRYRRGSIERVARLAWHILGDRTLDQDQAQDLLTWCGESFFA